ncbi:MAG: GNAT family N-acetyltransferase [Candidatus Dormibacteria bacterium]
MAEVTIRSAQVTDLGRIDTLYHEGLQLALQGEGATQPVRLWQIVTRTLSSLLPLSTPSEMLYVLEEDGRVEGFIQGEILSAGGSRVTRGTEAVRVLNLSLSPERGDGSGGSLIDHLCNQAISAGISRVYVRTPEGHVVSESFKAQGFQHYASDRVLLSSEIEGLRDGEPAPAGLRATRKSDMLGLFALYLASTPREVSQVEAPDFEQWRAVYETEWLGRFGHKPAQSLVVDRGELVGWLGLEPGQPGRPHTLLVSVRADAAGKGEIHRALLAEGVRRLNSGGAAWVNIRNYDTVSSRVLQDAGFEVLGGQDLLVRELRARVQAAAPGRAKDKALAPAFG